MSVAFAVPSVDLIALAVWTWAMHWRWLGWSRPISELLSKLSPQLQRVITCCRHPLRGDGHYLLFF